jgi:transcription elongation GreA/GreB family factor
MAVDFTITREGEQALQVRVQRLRHQLDVEFAARLNEARGFGEIGGNDDYLQTLEERAVLASRLARLQKLLNTATVVDQRSATSETVAVGSVVEVEDLAAGVVHEHRLVGDYESLTPGRAARSRSGPSAGRSSLGPRIHRRPAPGAARSSAQSPERSRPSSRRTSVRSWSQSPSPTCRSTFWRNA